MTVWKQAMPEPHTAAAAAERVLDHLATLWGYEVRRAEVDAASERALRAFDAGPLEAT